MTAYVADLGGTTIKLGVVEGSRVLASDRLPARAGGGLAGRLDAIGAAFDRLADRAGRSAPNGVGLALPCLLSRDRRRVVSTVDKYPDAADLDLEAWARETWGAPLALEGDGVAALLGEWQCGAGRGCDDLAMLTFGTGIGSAAVVEGRPLRGAHGAGGVLFGHLTVRLGGEACLCGNVGCVETEGSTWALRRRYGDHADLEWLFAETDDPDRPALRAHVLEAWGAALVGVVHALDPERVVLGGGAMRARDQILPALDAHVRAHAWRPDGLAPLPLVVGELGDDAALIGLGWAVQTRTP